VGAAAEVSVPGCRELDLHGHVRLAGTGWRGLHKVAGFVQRLAFALHVLWLLLPAQLGYNPKPMTMHARALRFVLAVVLAVFIAPVSAQQASRS